jgi:hypothetical protein
MNPQPADVTRSRLDDISTEWTVVRDPPQFVLRYAPAIQRYLAAFIKNHHDAEEVSQDFFMRVAQHGFARTRREGGRFRDYLKVALRNAALNFLQRHRASQAIDPAILQSTVPDPAALAANSTWIADWRRCLLDHARRTLEQHQDRSPGNLFHTVLNMIVDNPLDDTATLAARTSDLIGRPLRAPAFRKQVSRARYMLAKIIVQEVARTLDCPTPEQIKEELIELALWEYIRDFVPSEGRLTRKKKAPA